ncbi:N-acetylmuramoyl-L-alanine amidase family protein [Brevibacillus migulae]|uniref:N-acetylmuramoyl-L-alanine amidase family protein n=1 Tax=Brevibacillus migulae TaxID=1644114 RepID=UPI00106EFC8C|nr:N-acetylmuramoyl-L-alanine amidase family protein [Brevibacillus migulae]
MKRSTLLICFLLVLVMFGGGQAFAASADEAVQLMMDGKLITPDVPPLVKNGRTLVPVRVIAEGLGAEVGWDQATSTATITRGGQRVVLQLNNKQAYINGKAVTMETPPLTYHQRMLLPLRFVGEALGATVGWDDAARTVIVHHTITLTLNQQDVTSQFRPLLLGEQAYIPAQKLAEYMGAPHLENLLQGVASKTLDGQAYVTIDQAENILDARIKWEREENRIEVKRETELEKIEAEDTTIFLATSRAITPKHFTLQGPHRIVLDLPQTVLSDDLEESLNADGQGTARLHEPDEDEEDQVELDTEQSLEQAGDDENSGEDQMSTMEDQLAIAESASELAESSQASAEEDSLIKAIRYSHYTQSPDSVRVVIELNQKSKYTVEQKEDGLQITLNPIPRKTGYLIVVDAGHGGKDNGAKGVSGNVEKDFNLSVSKMLVEKLKQYPEFQVVATRSTDVFLELSERVEIANERDADLFISIHANSASPTSRGTETFYYNQNSQVFAQVVHRHLLAATQFPDRKVKNTGFYVIKHTKMPAVLTETGFLSNAIENQKLKSPEFQQKVAAAFAAAIREYYLTVQ